MNLFKLKLEGLRSDLKMSGQVTSDASNSQLMALVDLLIAEAEKPKERWQPKEGEWYYYVNTTTNEVEKTKLLAHFSRDEKRLSLGNYFRSQDDASAVADRLRTFWSELKQ